MAKIRIGLGSEFNLNNSNLGLGVTNPQVRLDVDGTVKSKDFEVTGVTSFTAYEGFLRSDHQIDGDLTLKAGQGLNASLSGEIIVKDGVTVTVGAIGLGTTTVGIGTSTITTTIDSNETNLAGGSQIECLKVYNTFTPPSGGTNERPYAPKPGELYYNYDFKTIEFYDGYGWRQVDNTTRSGRMVVGGDGTNTIHSAMMQTVIMTSLGNGTNFGDLSQARDGIGAAGSSSRGVYLGGAVNPGSGNTMVNTIDYITMTSTGNAIDFGDLNDTVRYPGVHSSSTRLVTNVSDGSLEYIEISTTGNAIDGGNRADTGLQDLSASAGSPTRGFLFGGFSSPLNYNSDIESYSIASLGTATKFGDLISKTWLKDEACGNSVNAIMPIGSFGNFMQKVIYATSGNSIHFGDFTVNPRPQSSSTNTRAVFAAGRDASSTVISDITYVEFASGGNTIAFGDLGTVQDSGGATSDSHGGLGGF